MNVELIVEPTRSQDEKLGPIGALNFIIEQSEPRDLLILSGDNLFGFKLGEFLEFARANGKSSNAIFRFKVKEDVDEYGVVTLGKDQSFIDFREKQVVPIYRDVSTGCYLFRAPDVEYIPKYLAAGGDPDSIGSFVKWLILQGSPLSGFVFSSHWFDIGTREKLLQANSHYLIDSRHGNIEGKSAIEGPVQIIRGTIIRDSIIGPNVVIEHKVKIIESHVQDSLVMEGAIIQSSQVRDSVIGPGSIVEGKVIETVCGPNTKLTNM
jgi:glucose-1-phosphate thymidylyltransferase